MPEENTTPAPAPETEPVTPAQEVVSADAPPEIAPSEPVQPAETQTAQIPPNEPIAPVQTGILHNARELLAKARIAIQDRKRKKRDKIMLILATKNHITNDEVEKLLHVSDATATRYLSALEKEGKIKQEGRTGAGVVYSKI